MYIIHIDKVCDTQNSVEGLCQHKVTFLNDRSIYTEIMKGNDIWNQIKRQQLNTCLCDMYMVHAWFMHFGKYDKLSS